MDKTYVKQEWIQNSENIKSSIDNYPTILDLVKNTFLSGLMYFSDQSISSIEYSKLVTYHDINLNSNEIHHLFHLESYFNSTKKKFEETNCIVEWGGGYGNICKLIKGLNTNDMTYIIIDLPIFSDIQKKFLEQNNIESVIVEDQIILGKINLLSVDKLDIIKEYCSKNKVDSFITTWGLSESSAESIQFCDSIGLFDCDNILVALGQHQEFFNESKFMMETLGKRSVSINEIDILKTNYYIFK